MVKNREELASMASEWMKMAKADLRRQVIEFMESVGTDGAELAHALCISHDELEKIINGRGEIALSTFAKLLIATDNVIEIKPMSQSPFMGHQMPRTSTVKRDKNGRFMKSNPENKPSNFKPVMGEMPHFGGMPPMGTMPHFGGMPSMGEMPMFGEMGHPQRFGGMPMPKRNNRMNGNVNGQHSRYGDVFRNPVNQEKPNVSRRELVETIIANEWDEEIDMMNSTSDELMNFLMRKGLTHEHFLRMANSSRNAENNTEQPHNCNSECSSHCEAVDDTDEIMCMIQEELKRNPNLLDSVRKYIKG